MLEYLSKREWVFGLTGDRQTALGDVLQQSQYGVSSGSSKAVQAGSTILLLAKDGVSFGDLEKGLPIVGVVPEI